MSGSGHTVHYRAACQNAQRQLATVTQSRQRGLGRRTALYGCLRRYNGDDILQPGLVHPGERRRADYFIRTLLAQPLLWMRLRSHR